MKFNGSKQLLAAGLLSLPGSLQAQRGSLARANTVKLGAPEVAVILPPVDLRSQTR
jgi:hypothetical protein